MSRHVALPRAVRARPRIARAALVAVAITVTPISTGLFDTAPGARALAAPAMTALPSDVVPSQADVDAARAAAAQAGTALDRANATYQAAATELLRLQAIVAEAAQSADRAEAALTQATNSAQAAAAVASASSSTAAQASLDVRRQAALLWQDQNLDGTWSMLLDGGAPQRIADKAAALDLLGSQRQAVLDRATMTAGIAAEDQRRADRARSQQETATVAARQARADAQRQVDSSSARAAVVQRQQQAAIADLARLTGVATSVAQQRQDALAAEAARLAAEREAAQRAAAEQAANSGSGSAGGGSGSAGGGGWQPSGGLSPSEAQAAARSMMGDWGFGGDQWGCLQSLWNGESGWNWAARNPSSGAYGIPQSLPASKMASAGSDWLTNARTQISWGLTYIKGRYGSPCQAWSFWQSKSPHWY